MSRVGKLPVAIPSGVTVAVANGEVAVKGSKGELKLPVSSEVTIEVKDGNAWVKPVDDSARARSMWGTSRSLLSNMVEGVSEGFTVRLTVKGVGFRASADKQFLTLALGFSHDIKYAIPEGIEIQVEKSTTVIISGFDKRLVGQVAAEIRALRKPEPYKGKGVRYEDEYIRMKEGKKK